jgi:aspartate aminotransferase
VPISATLAANQAISHKPVHPVLSAKLCEHAGRNEYGPVAGSPVLREAAAGYWTRRGLPTRAADVVAGPGSKPLLYALLQAIGGDVALPQPSWVSYGAQVDMLGGTPLYVPTPDGHGGVPDPRLLANYLDHARLAGRDVRAMIMTLPDNPTGTLAAGAMVRQVCRVAREYDLTIISDEIYRDLLHDPHTEYVSPADVAPERTVVTTGLSKNLALGGWRLGVTRLPANEIGEHLKERLLTIASEIWSSPAAPVQYAAAFAFDEPNELRQRVADSRRLHAVMARAVAERFSAAGAQLRFPQGGFYLYPDFAPHRELLDARWSVTTGAELAELLLERYSVGVLPGSAFGDGLKQLRLRVATSQLYGETDQQREMALRSAYPLMLPWVSRALERLSTVLNDLTTSR